MLRCLIVWLAVVSAGCGGFKPTEYWLRQIKDGDVVARRDAIRELAGRDPERAVPALAEALQDENHYVRRDAAIALGKFGPAAAASAPALAKARKDKEKSVRAAAEAALKRIGIT